jgi:hypothetical protein
MAPWIAGTLIPLELREAAVGLIGLDAFIHNPDRRVKNPNLLWSRQSLLAIDHGDAFSFLVPLLGSRPDPAEDPVLDILDQHVFVGGLGRKVPSHTAFKEAASAITDEQIQAIGDAAPTAWQTGPAAGKLAKILDVMRRRRDAIGKWLPLVEARVQQ